MQISRFGRLVIIFLSLTLSSVYGVSVSGKNLRPHIMDYAKAQANKVMTYISTSVIEDLNNEVDINNEDIVKYYEKDEDKIVDFNTQFLNNFLSEATKRTLNKIKEIEKGEYDKTLFANEGIYPNDKGIIYEVPVGLITNNVILSNVGGKIPVKFEAIGGVEGNITSKTSSFGINNALINISLSLAINTRIIVPDSSEISNTLVDIPIFMYVLQGEVPAYFLKTTTVCSINEKGEEL